MPSHFVVRTLSGAAQKEGECGKGVWQVQNYVLLGPLNRASHNELNLLLSLNNLVQGIISLASFVEVA